jgi:hypothetical protein
MGIAHQHITVEKADENSVMQVVMQMCLKMGGVPWLLPKNTDIPCVIGLNSYLNPLTGQSQLSVVVLDGEGNILNQMDPAEQTETEEVIETLVQSNRKYSRVLYVASFDRFGLVEQLQKKLEETNEALEYCITRINDNPYFRFFATYSPRKAPRFGKVVMEVAKCSVEAYENAPQGAILKSEDSSYYLLTGKTIEKDALKRGCPTPIKLEFMATKGEKWKKDKLANYILSLCMMGRASGHMTRLPMPLYYLQSRDYYLNKFGAPKDEGIKQKIFYI